jgi:hypothetical protein
MTLRWMLRLPVQGNVMRPARKVKDEVPGMNFIKQMTTIRTPEVIAWSSNETHWLGPYILMEFVEAKRLDELLFGEDDKPLASIEAWVWEKVYRQVAQIFLQLSDHSFDSIGTLSEGENAREATWSVTSSPWTFKMNQIERLNGIEPLGITL